MKILIADDEAIHREFVRSLLTSQGYEVIEATDGRHALSILENPDLTIDGAVLDFNMAPQDAKYEKPIGKYNGASVAKVVHNKFPTIPIVMRTGNPKYICDIFMEVDYIYSGKIQAHDQKLASYFRD